MKVPALDLDRLRATLVARIPPQWIRPWIGVGFDVDSAGIRGLVVKHHAGQHTICAASSEPITEPSNHQATVDATRRVLESLNLSAYHAPIVSTAVRGSGVIVRFVTFPAMKPQELRQAAQFEAEKHIPYQASEVILDAQPLGPPQQGKQEVLLVAAKKELIEEHLKLLREAGVTPQIIDVEAFALVNAWEVIGRPDPAANPAAPSGATAVVRVGPWRTTLSIVTSARLRLTRDFPTGMEGEVREASPPVLEHLVKQFRLSFDYFENQYGQGIEQVALGGPAIQWTNFAESFGEMLGLPVHRWNPVATLAKDARIDLVALDRISPDLVVAAGLSFRNTPA